MARPPSNYHPLQEIRRILGLSQKDFAKTISVAPVTLKKIESRKLELSDEVASRIFAETEVPLFRAEDDYLERLGKDIPLTTWDGRPLSREQYGKTKEQAALVPLERIDRAVESLAFHIQILLEAACELTHPKPHLVFGALQVALNRIKGEFGLGGQVSAILAEYGSSWAPGYLGPIERPKPEARARRHTERKENWDLRKRGISSKKPKRRVP
jgi:DNA-binding XRE family transcriptional regulator